MSTKRDRIVYASQSVFIDGLQSNRVQTLNSSSTFRAEDISELGQLELIDVVDDVPTVAITMDHNNVDSAILIERLAGISFPSGRLTAGGVYYSGIAASDFANTAFKGSSIWAPTQDETKMGAVGDNTIEQTMFMDNCYPNRVEIACTVGANSTENYTMETDNKVWLLNAGRHVNYVSVSGGTVRTSIADAKDSTAVIISGVFEVASGINICGVSGQNALTNNKIGFLFKNKALSPCIRVKVSGYVTDAGSLHEIPVTSGLATNADDINTTSAICFPSGGMAPGLTYIVLPSGTVDDYDCTNVGPNDKFYMAYAADGYCTKYNTSNIYFNENAASGQHGALRQGQIEAYIVDKGSTIASGSDPTWRLQGVTITTDLTREPLMQLGNLRPYNRPVKLPIPITLAVDSTAADLETFAMFAGQDTAFDAGTLRDLDIGTLLRKKTLACIAYIYHQTDEEAAGTHDKRTWKETTTIVYEDGSSKTYTAGTREIPQKVIIVTNMYPTDEAYSISTTANATQRYGFAARNSLYIVDTHLISEAQLVTLEANITSITKV